MPYKDGFGPFAPEVYRVPTSYPYRDGLSGPEAAARSVAEIEKYVGASNVACVVIEPIHGEGGFVVPAPGFLPAVAEWCRAQGVVFVADEIQTGFGRTGDLFACTFEGVVPDLITLAKGIAGGLPLAAVTGRAEIMDAPHVSGLGGTYGGNPVACAAALAAIATIETEDLPARAREIGEIMLPALNEFAARHSFIGEVRGRGAMIAIELVNETGDPDPAVTAAIAKACHAEGMIVLTAGTYGNVIRFLPPLVMPPDLLREAMSLIGKVLSGVRG
jgi:4-aminobutyrate aminotransferase/(S)-3-amino-2-methylpropionate transaminase